MNRKIEKFMWNLTDHAKKTQACGSPAGGLAMLEHDARERAAIDINIPKASDVSPAECHEFIGRHLIASYNNCDPAALRDSVRLIAAMQRAVEASGATLLKTAEHTFPDGAGITAVMLLSESHAAIHTYPEYDACFVDLFTCGNTCNPWKFDAVMRAYLRPAEASARTLQRHRGIEDEFINTAI